MAGNMNVIPYFFIQKIYQTQTLINVSNNLMYIGLSPLTHDY